jgi:two-component system sensor histidine kinase and response regulator WspE
VGIEPAVRISHVMEDCFTAAKESRITLTSDAVDILLQGVDALQRICAPDNGEPLSEEALRPLVDSLTALKSSPPVASASATVQPIAKVETNELVAATVQPEEPSVTLAAVFDRGSSESLRKELLDTLSLAPARIQLDFGQVAELGADALALLASFVREADHARPRPAVEVRGVRPAVQHVLRLAGLGDAFVSVGS